MFCQDLSCKIIFLYAEMVEPLAMADPGAVMTIILIVVFVAAIAMGMLFLLGTRRQAIKSAAIKETRHRLPAPGYFNGLISLYKWAFNYDVRTAATEVSVESLTRISTPSGPDAATAVSVEPGTRAATIPNHDRLMRQPVPGRPYGLQAVIDLISDGIAFVFEGFINIFKWIFRIDR